MAIRTTPRATGLGLLLAAVLQLVPLGASALVGDSEGAIGLNGSVRTVTGATVNYDAPLLFGDHAGDGLSQTLLRLTLCGKPLDWLSFEVHGVQSLQFLTVTTSGIGSQGAVLPGLGLNAAADRYRALDATWDWADAGQLSARLWLDRANVKFKLPFADITVGRQAINFGKTYFWNPLDVFLPFDPRQFDRDYKGGVDGIRVDIPLGDFSGINLVGVAGRTLHLDGTTSKAVLDVSWYGSAVLARAYATLGGFDLSIQGGKIYGGYQVGGGFSGEAGPVEVRGEVAYFIADASDLLPYPLSGSEYFNHLSAVLGLGHRFENTLTIEGEYLYNGLGDPDHLESAFLRTQSGASFHASAHVLGLTATYEILPILTASLAWIFSLNDFSSLLQPGFSLSVSDEVDFIFGAMLALGPRPKEQSLASPLGLRSEFGTYPNVYYMEFKFYF